MTVTLQWNRKTSCPPFRTSG